MKNAFQDSKKAMQSQWKRLGHVQKQMGKALLELTTKMRGRKIDDGNKEG